MSIDRIGSDFLRSLAPGRLWVDGDRGNGEGPRHRAVPRRADRVELPAKSRALAARLPGGALGAARIAEIVGRIDAGVYDDPAVAEEVARRIHGSGDLLGDA